MNNNCLYFYINIVKYEIFYVGIGNEDRPYSKYNRNEHWHNTVNKYEYIIVIIKNNLSWNEACELEKYYIKQIGRKDLGLGTLVNWTDGGDGNNNPSEETRRKMGNGRRGKLFSEENKIKFSISAKNMSPEKRKKIVDNHIKVQVLQFDKENNFIKEWRSATEAANFLNIRRNHIYMNAVEVNERQ